MVWACGKNGRVPYGHKGVGRSQWGTGTKETEVRMDGVKVAIGNRGMTGGCAKDRKEWRALVHM